MDVPEKSKRSVRVSIFNQTYSISASDDPARTEDLARSVDELMSSIARRAGNLDTARTAVLACLHLADQLRSVQEELASFHHAVDRKSRDFSLVLDRAFSSVRGEVKISD